jgi:hypothetical protein
MESVVLWFTHLGLLLHSREQKKKVQREAIVLQSCRKTGAQGINDQRRVRSQRDIVRNCSVAAGAVVAEAEGFVRFEDLSILHQVGEGEGNCTERGRAGEVSLLLAGLAGMVPAQRR